MEKKYPEQLERIKSLIGVLSKQLPGPVSGFSRLYKAALDEGALGTKMKELIALAISISAGCEGRISFHVHDALRAAQRDRRFWRLSVFQSSWAEVRQ